MTGDLPTLNVHNAGTTIAQLRNSACKCAGTGQHPTPFMGVLSLTLPGVIKISECTFWSGSCRAIGYQSWPERLIFGLKVDPAVLQVLGCELWTFYFVSWPHLRVGLNRARKMQWQRWCSFIIHKGSPHCSGMTSEPSMLKVVEKSFVQEGVLSFFRNFSAAA